VLCLNTGDFPIYLKRQKQRDWNQNLDTFSVAIGLLGGLALFLFGLEQLADGLKAVAGDRMKAVLAKLTDNRFFGVITGAFVTAVIQSSSVTTVLVVGFISAGVMGLGQSVAVIMGANIGTTVTAQIIAFKATKLSYPLIAVGFSLLFFGKTEKFRQYGHMIMGLGMVFLGMNTMGEAMHPLRSSEDFLALMVQMENPFLGILVGAAFTALVQSSSATTGIVIVLASQGLIGLSAGIALIFGANIGTCITALLAAIGKPREAVQAAIVHVLFNTAGVLLWVGFIDQLVEFVESMTPIGSDGQPNTPRLIANAHTVFNIANTFIFIWFSTQVGQLAQRLVPEKPKKEEKRLEPKYLKDELVTTSSLALDAVRMEIREMGRPVKKMMRAIMPATLTGTRHTLNSIAHMDSDVDYLHGHIIRYLRRIGLERMTERESGRFVGLMEIANYVENIGDIIETDLVVIGKRRIDEKIIVSPQTEKMLHEFSSKIEEALSLTLEAVLDNDGETARKVIEMKGKINNLAVKASEHGANRLLADEPNRMVAYRREMEIVEKLRRIYYFTKRIAKIIDEANQPESNETPEAQEPPLEETDAPETEEAAEEEEKKDE